jgi:hypothetical protein
MLVRSTEPHLAVPTANKEKFVDHATRGDSVFLVKKGDPPALLGRQAEFDSSRHPIVTPKREPPSNTLRRNYETGRQFKSQPLGV